MSVETCCGEEGKRTKNTMKAVVSVESCCGEEGKKTKNTMKMRTKNHLTPRTGMA